MPLVGCDVCIEIILRKRPQYPPVQIYCFHTIAKHFAEIACLNVFHNSQILSCLVLVVVLLNIYIWWSINKKPRQLTGSNNNIHLIYVCIKLTNTKLLIIRSIDRRKNKIQLLKKILLNVVPHVHAIFLILLLTHLMWYLIWLSWSLLLQHQHPCYSKNYSSSSS